MTTSTNARRMVALVLAFALTTAACSGGSGGSDDEGSNDEGSEPELSGADLAAEAYVAGSPLVVSVRTLQRLGGLVGVNRLFWQNALSGPENRIVVAPNRDTLYSIAVLDLRSEPMALTLPAVTDRYYTYQLLDAWTESFAYIGTRATGGRAGTWVITPPGWDGELPPGAERLESPTPQVFLLGRFLVDDDADIPNVTAISHESTLQPLSALTGTTPPPPPPPLGQPAGTPQDIPTDATFFDELGDALAINPPTTPAQQELFAQAEQLGIGPGEHPAAAAAARGEATDPAAQRSVLDEGAAAGDRRITDAIDTVGEMVNGWSVNLGIGRYGDDLLTRAVVARVGWGANVPEEAVYPIARLDADGEPLDGAKTYRITFPAGALPPVEAFWSLSVYGEDMFFAEHPSGRYSIGDRTPDLVHGDDGSLEIVLSHDQPPAPAAGVAAANWLPVPDGPFVLMMRLYLPGEAVIDGTYELPPVEPESP
jgi:hypothetical protein